MSYVQLALLGLQIVKWFLQRAHDNKQFQAGQDAEIAKATTEILRKTDAGKKLMEKIDALSDGELDDLADAISGASKG